MDSTVQPFVCYEISMPYKHCDMFIRKVRKSHVWMKNLWRRRQRSQNVIHRLYSVSPSVCTMSCANVNTNGQRCDVIFFLANISKEQRLPGD
ncbi:hypothetical protein O9G_005846 [Rozella allomycis CSF55]|uniref:Uncharacterized protein n=1 Tax=Rozella allomycis (strain CSF55) TaxID=988480 RepID=A0A075B4P7_ROZAC|nr:hypothetical protein O9G_005846 [Rozella allomycis CSF55]|eukprot:EPZ36364.1 hypothetical protein O9G_005846 [Rozella allomycis CSF55]